MADVGNPAPEYSGKTIRVLESATEAIRLRPIQFIGDMTARGLHLLILELIDNAIQQANAGLAREVRVTLHNDGSATVSDDEPGIPLPVADGTLEPLMTQSHYGSAKSRGPTTR